MISKSNRLIKATSAMLAVCFMSMQTAYPLYADSLPSGYQPVAGSSSYEVSADGSTGTLTASDAVTIGNWAAGFNVGAGHTFNALLPADGVHLSRDITSNPSEIFGSLNVPQGKFFLVNTNGIFFAPGAQVNAAGLVASTLDISNQDFLNGKYHFVQAVDPASIVNAGNINIGKNGGALIGGSVENTGVIVAKEGDLALVSGKETTVSFDQGGMLSVIVDKAVDQKVVKNGEEVKKAVSNKGIMKTEGGNILMTSEAANDIFDSLVNNSGIIEAQSLGSRNGKIELISKKSKGIVQNSGTIKAQGLEAGEKGGRIEISGENVAITDGLIDASGDSGAGQILIGGDYQGQGTLRNANNVYVGKNAEIKADALVEGDGGKVVVWSDKFTEAHGSFSAKGGTLSGDGGLVETSSHENLNVSGIKVDASAVNGKAGNYLIDPTDITIINAANGVGDADAGPFTLTGNTNTISNGAIEFFLNAGTNVTILTTSGFAGSGFILQNADALISQTGGFDTALTLNAITSLTLNGGITSSSGKLDVNLVAGTGVVIANDITTNGGLFTSSGTTFDSTASIITTGDGSATINHTDSVALGVLNAGVGTVNLTAGNGATQTGVLTAGDLLLNGTGNFVLDQNNNAAKLAANVTGAVTYKDADGFQVGTVGATDGITAGGNVDLTATAGNVDLAKNIGTTAGSVVINGNTTLSDDVTVQSAGALATDDVTINGTVTGGTKALVINAGLGDASVTGDATGLSAFTATGNTIGVQAVTTSGSQLYTGNTTVDGNLTSTTAGSITVNGNTTLLDNTTIQTAGVAATDDITLNGTVDGGTKSLILNAGVADISVTGNSTNLSDLTATANTIGVKAVTTTGAQSYTGSTTLAGDLTSTTAGSILVTGNTTLSDNVTIQTAGVLATDDITLDGTITGGTKSLTLNAGAADASVTGSATGLSALTATANTIGVKAVTTSGSQLYTGSTTVGGNLTSTTAGSVTVNGNTTLSDNVTIQTAGVLATDDVTLNGTVDGGTKSLTVNAGVADVSVTGNSSNLSALTATGNTIGVKAVTTTGSQLYTGSTTLGGNLTSSTAGSVTVNGNTTLTDNITIQTAGVLATDDITLNGTVDGGTKALILNAGAADVSVTGNATNLSDLTATANTIGVKAVTTTASQLYTGSTTLGGNLTSTTAGSITVNGNTTLSDNITIQTAGAAATDDITLNGTVDGGTKSLTANAGVGDVSVTGNASNLSALTATANTIGVKAVTTTGSQLYTGNTTLSGDLSATTAGSTITVNGNTVLADVDATAGTSDLITVSATDGDVNFNGMIDGTVDYKQSLTINAGTGNIGVTGDIGTVKPLETLTLNNTGTQTLPAVINVMNLAFSNLSLGADTSYTMLGTFTANAINTNGYDLSITSGEINFTGAAASVTGGGALALRPFTAALLIVVGGIVDLANQLDINTSEIAALDNGFDSITIGRADGTGGIDINAATFVDPVTFLSPVAGSINVLGNVTGTDNASITIDGSGSTTNLSASLLTSGSDITISDNVNLLADVSLDTTQGGATAGANVSITGTTLSDATPRDLTINAGTAGTSTLTGAVGTGANNLDQLSVTAGQSVFGSTVRANSIASTATNTTFTNNVSSLTGNASVTGNLILANDIIVTSANDATVTGSVESDVLATPRDLTVTATGTATLGGAVGATNNVDVLSVSSTENTFGSSVRANQITSTAANTNLGGDATSLTGDTQINGNLTLTNDVIVTTTGNDFNVTGDVDSDSVGTQRDLTVNAGAGTVTISGSTGTFGIGLDDLTIASASAVNFGDAAGDDTVYVNNFSSSATTTRISDGIDSFGDVTVNGDLEVTEDSFISTGAGSGDNILVTGTTKSVGGNHDLTITSGFGDTTFTGAVGAGTDFFDFLDILGDEITFGSTVQANDILINSTETTFTDDVTSLFDDILVNGDITLAGDVLITSADDFTVTGNTNSDATDRSLTVNVAGDASFNGNIGSTNNINLLDVTAVNSTFGGTVQANNVKSSATTTTFTDDVTALTDDVQVVGNLVLAGDTTVTTGGAATDDFSVSGTTNGAFDLTINTGDGDATFTQSVGAGTRLADVVIQNAHNVMFTGDLNAQTITQAVAATGGTTSFLSNVNTNGAAGINLTGVNFLIGDAVSDTVTTTNGGPFIINNSGLLTLNSTLILDGPFQQTGTGAVALNNDITNFNDISFNGDLTLGGAGTSRTLNAGTGKITFDTASSVDANVFDFNVIADEVDLLGAANTIFSDGAQELVIAPYTTSQDLTIGGTVDGSAALDLSAAEVAVFGNTAVDNWSHVYLGNANGTGNIIIDAITFVDPTTLRSPLAGGSLYVNGQITGIDDASITLDGSGATTHLAADIVTAGADILISDSVILLDDISLDTTTGANVTITGTVNGTSVGTEDLDINAGATGNITLGNSVGNTTRIGALSFVNANQVLANSITATSISQVAGTSSSTFNGALNTSQAAGINITTGGAVNLNNSITTTGNGGVSIANGGVLTIASNADMNLDGAFVQTGAGTVTTSGDIVTTSDNISFSTAVTLADHVLFNSNGGDITFDSAVNGTTNGAEDLTMNAGIAGNILFSSTAGTGVRLGDVLISNANNVTFSDDLRAASLAQSSGVGSSVFNGAINTNTSGGIVLNGNNFTFGDNAGTDNVTTTGNGVMTITNTGDLTMNANADLVLDGAFSQVSGGPLSAVSMANDISTTNDDVTFNSSVTLAGPVSINTGAGLGNIVFNDTINGAQDLSMSAGLGSIQLNDVIGGVSRIGILTITSAQDVNAVNISAASIAQSGVTGTSNYNGTLNTNTAAGINLAGNNINLNQAVTTTGNGVVVLNNSGLLNIASAADMNLDGAFSQTGAGNVKTSGDITTTNDNISFAAPVVLSGDVSMNTGAGAGDITFSNTVDGTVAGNEDMTLSAGTGNINLVGNVGSTQRIGNLILSNVNGVFTSTGSITAASISQNAGTGTTTFNGALDLNTAQGLDLNGSIMNINAPVTTTNGGIVELTNGGLLTIASAADMNLDGSFTQNGAGAVNLGGDIRTTADDIRFDGAVDLTSNVLLDTTMNGTQPSGADIRFTNALDSTTNSGLTLRAGTNGDVRFDQAVGSNNRLGDLLVQSAYDLNAQSSITAASITQSTGAHLTLFEGALNTNNVNANGNGVEILAQNILIRGTTTTSNFGNVQLNNLGDLIIETGADMTLDGSFLQSGLGQVQLGANITTNAANITFDNNIILTSDSVLTSANGNIQLNGSVDGLASGTQDLTLNAGNGSIVLGNPIGSTTRLGSMIVTNAADWTATNITATSIRQDNGTGTTTFNGALNTNGNQGIDLTGNQFDFNASVTTTNNGGVSIDNASDLNIASNADMNLDGAFDQIGAGDVFTAGDISTTADNISFAGPVILTGDVTLDSVGGDIVFNDTVDGTVDGAEDLSLIASTGDIELHSTIGNNVRLGLFEIQSVHDVSADATASIEAASIVQLAGTGTSQFNGMLATNTIAGMSFTGLNFEFNEAVSTTGSGTFTVNNSGDFSTGVNGDFNLTGDFTQNHAAPGATASLMGDIITAGNDITFNSPVTLNGDVFMDSNDGNIAFNGTVDGFNDLMLDSGSGNIQMNQAVGSNIRLGDLTVFEANNWTVASSLDATSINQVLGSGATTFNGAVSTDAAAGIDLNGNIFNINSSVTTTGAGTVTITNAGLLTIASAGDMNLDGAFLQDGLGLVSTAGDIATNDSDITFFSAVTLTGNVSMNSSVLAGGDINFNNTLNGSSAAGQNISLTAGTGDINFNQPVGQTTRLGSVTINSAADVNVLGAFSSASINQVAGSGTTTFNAPVDTNAVAGIDLNGTKFTINDTITTTNGGTVTITNSDALSIAAGANMDLDGAFSQDGNGLVDTAGNITTTNDNITFHAPVTLTGNVAMNTGAGAGNITFDDTVDASAAHGQDLTLTAGTGNILFSGFVGQLNRLGALLINSASNVTVSKDMFVGNIQQTAGSGTTAFNGALDADTLAGIDITGTNVTFGDNAGVDTISTSNGGTVNINNSGVLTMNDNADFSLDGAFSQIGSGNVVMFSNITTTNDNVSFTGPVRMADDININTGAGVGNIQFGGTLNGTASGSEDLNLTAGTGNVSFVGAVGGTTRIGVLTINSASDVTNTAALSAASVNQVDGSGTTTFNGPVNTNTLAGIDLNGNAFTINNTVTTTTGGTMTVTNGGLLTISAAGDMSLDGEFHQDGAGLVSTAGDITTSADNITFDSAVTLTGNSSMDSNGGNMLFSSNVSGANNLTLESNAGNINFASTVGAGTPLAALLVTSANNVDFNGAVNAASVKQNAGTGTTTIQGTMNTTGAAGVDLTGNNFVINNNVTAAGTGIISVVANDQASSNILLNGALTTAGGNVTLSANDDVVTTAAGDIASNNGNISVTADRDANAAGALTMNYTNAANVSVFNSGSGTITMSSAENMSLGMLVSTSASNSAVSLTSTAGRIIDGGEGNPLDIDASNGGLVASAATGIGLTTDPNGALETNVHNLNVTTLAGDINLNVTPTQALTIQNASVTAGPGNINIANLSGFATNIVNMSTVGGAIFVPAGGAISVNGFINGNGLVVLSATGNMLINQIISRKFILRATGDIVDANGDAPNLFAGETSKLEANGLIGSHDDALDVNIGNGDLIAIAGAQNNGVSANVQGFIAGDFDVNKAPGLMLFNTIVRGGEPIGLFDSAIASEFNYLSFGQPNAYMNDLSSIDHLRSGMGMNRVFEFNLKPELSMMGIDELPSVLVDVEEEKNWTKSVLPAKPVQAPQAAPQPVQEPVAEPIPAQLQQPMAPAPVVAPIQNIQPVAAPQPQVNKPIQPAQLNQQQQPPMSLPGLMPMPASSRLFQQSIEEEAKSDSKDSKNN